MGGPKQFVEMRHVGDAAIGGDFADWVTIGGQCAGGVGHAEGVDVVGRRLAKILAHHPTDMGVRLAGEFYEASSAVAENVRIFGGVTSGGKPCGYGVAVAFGCQVSTQREEERLGCQWVTGTAFEQDCCMVESRELPDITLVLDGGTA